MKNSLVPEYSTLVRFAIPVMLASIATPLMGMVDTAVLGRLNNPSIIAAAGVGATLFTIIYWCFAFLRYTTVAFVSQAVGRDDPHDLLLAGLRPMLAALGGGLLLWTVQWPIGKLLLCFLSPPPEVTDLARRYYGARIWSAPFTLLGYAQFAWLMGQGRVRTVMLLQIILNSLNAALAILYVLQFDWGIAGAAWATVTSEGVICALTTAIIIKIVPIERWHKNSYGVMNRVAWRRLFASNIDITLRTLLLTGAFALMTERAGQMGIMDLAANQILMQAFLLVANLLDGFATAAEVFGARAIGADSRPALEQIVGRCAMLSLGWGVSLAAVLFAIKTAYLSFMTSNLPLREAATLYWPWLGALPLICIWAFFWDGVFMGAMRTRTLRNTMLGSVALYVPALFVLSSIWGNHGIWAALLLLMAARSSLLTLAWPALKQSVGVGRR